MNSARFTAAKLLIKVDNGSYSNIVLDNEFSSSELSKQDKKFAGRIFYGVIERKITLDYIISAYSSKSVEKLDNAVRNVLRMGLYQLLYMPSVPDNAAVNESVNLIKQLKKSSAAGLVNAVLRSFIRNNKCIKLPEDKHTRISINYSCPVELVKSFINDYGEENAVDILESAVTDNSFTIRTNTKKINTQKLKDILSDCGLECEISDIISDCIKINSISGVENNQAFKDGLFHVQDISSQLCCMALSPAENDTVLDVCSAPGGKAFTIAELMNDNGRVLAYDLHENRVRLIKSGAERLDLKSIICDTGDATKYNEDIPAADKILCDVVCAGYGVIGKKPEIKYKKLSETERLPDIQYRILDNSSKYLKVGGELVYSTCSLTKKENDDIIDKFLNEHKDEFEGVSFLGEFGKPFGNYKATIFPKYFGSDGFFISKIRRIK